MSDDVGGECKKFFETKWKPALFITIMIVVSYTTLKKTTVMTVCYSGSHGNVSVLKNQDGLLKGKSAHEVLKTTPMKLPNPHSMVKTIKRSFKRAKGSFVFKTSYAANSSFISNSYEIPGLDSMDKYVKLPRLSTPYIGFAGDVGFTGPGGIMPQQRDFKFLISYNDTCKKLHNAEDATDGARILDFDNDVFLLVTIKSMCRHFERRHVIRNTWGNETWVFKNLGVRMKLVFLLGRCANDEETKELLKEGVKFRDILQWDFVESFQNLSVKHIHIWQWYATHCMDVPFLLQGDDDFLMNIRNILHFLLILPTQMEQDLWVGSVLSGQPVVRKPITSRYYVNKIVYSERTYPPYVSGGGFLISGCLVVRLFVETLTNYLVRVDDGFVGILARGVDVKPVHNTGFKSWGMKDKERNAKEISVVMTYHCLGPPPITDLWNDLVDFYAKADEK